MEVNQPCFLKHQAAVLKNKGEKCWISLAMASKTNTPTRL